MDAARTIIANNLVMLHVGGGTPKHTKDTGQKLLGNTSDSSTAADGGN